MGGLTPEEDGKRAETCRRTVGDEFIIATDANQAWKPREAISFARAVEELNIAWLEEPVWWYDQIRGMRMVRKSTNIPVTVGQSAISKYGCRDLVEDGAVDICNADVTCVDGITEWRRIGGLATAYDVAMAHHEEPQVELCTF